MPKRKRPAATPPAKATPTGEAGGGGCAQAPADAEVNAVHYGKITWRMQIATPAGGLSHADTLEAMESGIDDDAPADSTEFECADDGGIRVGKQTERVQAGARS